jgi:hypothetical protein
VPIVLIVREFPILHRHLLPFAPHFSLLTFYFLLFTSSLMLAHV